MAEYLRHPDDIYRRSFEQARAETDLSALPITLRPIALRLVHACGMPDLVGDLAWSGDVASATSAALSRGAPIVVDCRMVEAGIARRRLPAVNRVICLIDEPSTARRAVAAGTTRSAAAVDGWRPWLRGAVVAIGNAPTALFRLLEILGEGAEPPAALFAFPVGFVGAAESKQLLARTRADLPFVTTLGRRGGSGLAAAGINAVLSERR